jgi:hypothetical protein
MRPPKGPPKQRVVHHQEQEESRTISWGLRRFVEALRQCTPIVLWRYLTDRPSWLVLILVLPYYVSVQLNDEGLDVAHWDWLVLSGWITTVIGLRLAETIPTRMHYTIERLFRRGSLETDEATLTRLRDELERKSLRWGTSTGLLVSIAVLVASAWAFSEQIMEKLLFLLFAVPGGFVIGIQAGK